MTAAEAVRAYLDAFNAEDLDALTAVLAEDVEIQSQRGLIVGRQEARRWATRNPAGELRQRLVLEDVEDHGSHAVARVRKQWAWADDHEAADEQEIFCVATMRDGLIARWAPFDDRDAALRAAGVNS